MQAKTIDEVIQALDDIVDWAYTSENRLGYFAALYRKVTLKVKEGMAEGTFQDGERMARLDVNFANFYLEAFQQFQNNKKPAKSWQLAFEAAKHWWPIVLQHLLLGINAHINLDLGIAAARTSPEDAVHDLKNDFDQINEILTSLVDGVQRELTQIWPVHGLLDLVGGTTDETLINFSIKKARIHAWKVAENLAPLEPTDQRPKTDALDKKVAILGRKIRHPGSPSALQPKSSAWGREEPYSRL